MLIRPVNSLRGTVRVPGDKSISHRAAMLSAIAEGTSKIDNFASSADCSSTLECLKELGVSIRREGSRVTVAGVGKFGLSSPVEPLDCGNSGTTMRLLAGILAGQDFESVLIGDESLQSRPMKRIIEPLGEMGVTVASNQGKAPLTIAGIRPLTPIDYSPPVASAQIKSCVLLAGLYSDGVTRLTETAETRDHTERMLRWFGVEVVKELSEDGWRISIDGNSELSANDIVVPSDISSAAFFMVAGACLKGSDILLPRVGINPTRRAVLDILSELGADVHVDNLLEVCNEQVADLRIRGESLTPVGTSRPVLAGNIIANIIDEIPILAVFGTQLETGLEFREATELRVKESDRIMATVENLRRMGAEVDEFPDGFAVSRSRLKGAVLDSFGDHRIAMAFSIAGLLADGHTEIKGADCADVSYPGFYDALDDVRPNSKASRSADR